MISMPSNNMKDFNRLLAKTCERFKANENEIKVYTNSYAVSFISLSGTVFRIVFDV